MDISLSYQHDSILVLLLSDLLESKTVYFFKLWCGLLT